jgi:hypothetical protein
VDGLKRDSLEVLQPLQVFYELVYIFEPLSKTVRDFSPSLQDSSNYPRILFKRYSHLFGFSSTVTSVHVY